MHVLWVYNSSLYMQRINSKSWEKNRKSEADPSLRLDIEQPTKTKKNQGTSFIVLIFPLFRDIISRQVVYSSFEKRKHKRERPIRCITTQRVAQQQQRHANSFLFVMLLLTVVVS